MRAIYDGDALELEFEGTERELLVMSLTELQKQYEVALDELPPALQAYWKGTLSSQPDPTLAEAAEDLKDARLAWRSERLNAVDHWLGLKGSLLDKDNDFFVLEADEIDLFLAVLNDRRLSLAALHDFGDAAMEIHPSAAPAEAQRALWEVHLLAFIMEHCLQAMEEEEE